MQSPRFGVIDRSKTASSNSRYSPTSAPTGASSGRINRPLASSARPSSASEQHMPKLVSPRILPFLIVSPLGRQVPIVATGTLSPSPMFEAPQTMASGSFSLMSTCSNFNLSASGCGFMDRIWPTRTPLTPARGDSTPSTSCPRRTSVSAISAGVAESGVCSSNQDNGSFMAYAPIRRKKRTSFSKNSLRSGMPCLSITRRSTPSPKAKPENTSASMPTDVSTFG